MTHIDPVIEELNSLLSKKNLAIGYEFSFPRYNILPDEVRLALSVIKSHGMKISLSLHEVDKNKSK